MKTAIVFYSFGGATKRFAQKKAAERNADVYEVHEQKKKNIFTSFLIGCPQALSQKSVPLAEKLPDLSEYDTILVMAPIWANFPAPAFNSIVDSLPKGKKVEIYLLSGSGDSSKSREKVQAKLKNANLNVVKYVDIKQ